MEQNIYLLPAQPLIKYNKLCVRRKIGTALQDARSPGTGFGLLMYTPFTHICQKYYLVKFLGLSPSNLLIKYQSIKAAVCFPPPSQLHLVIRMAALAP